MLIGDRVVLRSDGGPPEAEYALFEPHEIVLHQSDPGIIREEGYRTTVQVARKRLETAGVTLELADKLANRLSPSLATAYARGETVRRVVPLLDASELLEGHRYDVALRRYVGYWLDLKALTFDAKALRATISMQALHLATILNESAAEAPVFLSTAGYTADRKPGERSYRRVSLERISDILQDASKLGDSGRPSKPPRDVGPTRVELLDHIRQRLKACGTSDRHEHLTAIERALLIREPPARGPLADPELWAVEVQLEMRNYEDIVAKLDALERARGRQPATAYLRAKVALALNLEPPREIAERVSALSTSMSSFWELELLAARAWFQAGDKKRAAAFARDLIDNPKAPDELRVQGLELLDALGSLPPGSSAKLLAAERNSERSPDTAIAPTPIISLGSTKSAEPENPAHFDIPPPPARPADLVAHAELVDDVPVSRRRGRTSQRPPAPSWEVPEDPRSIPSRPPPPPTPMNGEAAAAAEVVMSRGASQPPYRSSAPPPPVAPLPPRPMPNSVGELAELLSLPPGLHGQPPGRDAIPRTLLDARINFTHLSRELGREYRIRHKLELRADSQGIETIQRYLRERFKDGQIRSTEDAFELRRHGAFLSEVLARTLGAYWVDIGPSELGYWAMIVPPNTRVWPFGRLLRFLAMGHKERDLVSYYLELQSRASG